MSAFTGFSNQTFAFLKGLAAHNEKKWFDANRDVYQGALVVPAVAFVEAMAGPVSKISKTLRVEPRINGSIKRINRDIRFSKDKSPYKTHLDVMFTEGDARMCGTSSLFLRMFGDRMVVGVGAHDFSKEAIGPYRDAVVDKKLGPALDTAIGVLRKAGYTVGGTHYKRVPAGYDAEHPNAPYLLHGGLYAYAEMAIPKDAVSAKFVSFCVKHYTKLAPIHHWLRDALS